MTQQPLARRLWSGWVLALAGALLLANTQGLVHRVVHGAHHQAAFEQDHSEHHVGDKHAGNEKVRWLARLFATHDDGDTVCRLLDQSGSSAALPSAALPGLPLLAIPRHVACHEAHAPAPPAALTQARGPPAFR